MADCGEMRNGRSDGRESGGVSDDGNIMRVSAGDDGMERVAVKIIFLNGRPADRGMSSGVSISVMRVSTSPHRKAAVSINAGNDWSRGREDGMKRAP